MATLWNPTGSCRCKPTLNTTYAEVIQLNLSRSFPIWHKLLDYFLPSYLNKLTPSMAAESWTISIHQTQHNWNHVWLQACIWRHSKRAILSLGDCITPSRHVLHRPGRVACSVAYTEWGAKPCNTSTSAQLLLPLTKASQVKNHHSLLLELQSGHYPEGEAGVSSPGCFMLNIFKWQPTFANPWNRILQMPASSLRNPS